MYFCREENALVFILFFAKMAAWSTSLQRAHRAAQGGF